MRFSLALFVFSAFSYSQLSYSAACPASTTATATGAANGSNCTVTGTASTIQLNFISGFSDATGIAGAGGNNGTTLGAQRKLSFIKAAEILADQIQSSQTVIMDGSFTGLSCNAVSATLGSAGATVSSYHPAPPVGMTANTWYPIGLYNDISNSDNLTPAADAGGGYSGNGTGSDINARFNSNIGQAGCLASSNGWYYGFDAPPANYIGFTTVLLHEATHGLGFASLTSASTGAKSGGRDDVFSNNLYSQANSADWPGLSDAQRAASAVSSTGLLWNGANVNAQAVGVITAGFQNNDGDPAFTSGDRIQMYAPNPVEAGSSVSHFNTAASPNELMEPQYTEGQFDLGLALYLLKDIGWGVTPAVVANATPTITAVDQSTNEDVAKVVDVSGWANDTDGDPLTFSVTTCPANITCSVSGSDITFTPALNHNGASHSITVEVSDGNGGTASDSFNLNVVAQNDAPSISGIPNQSIKVGEYKDISLSGYASDVDGDGLSYSDTACGANLTCTFPNATTLRVAAGAGGLGTTVSVTIEADDSNGGTNTDSFDVTITSAVPSTTIEVGGSAHNDGGSFVLSSSTTQINVNNGSGNYSYDLDYNSSDVSSLVSSNASGLTIGLPASGEFAGDYTLTITDNGDGDVITITVTRPLRLNWSATSILNGNTAQTLKIEGGAAGTVYSLVQSGSADLIFRNDGGTAVTTATAENNAATFNVGLLHLDSAAVAAISTMDVTVQSTYDDVIENSVKVYPSTSHSFTVKSTADEALANSTATLNGGETLLADLSLVTAYSADANGQFTILLPDTNALPAGANYSLSVGATGYASETLSLDSDLSTHNVVLTELENAITLTGNISAQGSQDFSQNPPSASIGYSDSNSESLTVVVNSATQATFSKQVDLNTHSLSTLSVNQVNSVNIELDISNVTENRSFNILLARNVTVVTSTPTRTEQPVDTGSAAGGSMNWPMLLVLLLMAAYWRVSHQAFKRLSYKRIPVRVKGQPH